MKKRKIDRSTVFLAAIDLIFIILFTYFVSILKIMPVGYIVLIVTLLFMISLISILLLKKKNKGFKVVGYIISFIVILISALGIYYLNKTNKFLDKAFDNAKNSYTSTYYVLTLDNDDYSEITDIKDETLGYYENVPNIDEALKKLKEKVSTDNKKYEQILDVFKDLDKKKISATVIESSLYEALTKESKLIDENKYQILYKFDITIEEETEEIVDDGNTVNIYIGGTDFTQKNNDFNMIVTINKKTHKILLTSIPRDFYVTVNGRGMKDLLGYAGYFGINTSRKTMEDLFGVNIDYFVKIDTNSLVGLVDTLGGVEFCSDKTFTTTHAMIMGSYDDEKGQKLQVKQGCYTYNGIQILTISRERLAYVDGDRQRQRNCQNIMISIFKKMTRPENIANYSNVLNAVSNLYTTNIPRDLVSELAKDTITNGAGWTFEQQSVTGRDSSAYVHMGTVKDYVMIPNPDSINQATAKMKNIARGK